MASLNRTLRKDLENVVKKTRRAAEAGARQAIEQLAVHHHEPWGTLSPEQRKLRNRLRAHGRQLGDRRDERKGTQGIDRLVSECAYEHWHRLLFARFLAENDLLVEPKLGMALSLEECRELARERGIDWLMLASDFAQRMLPQIFRTDDPVLEVTLPPEKRQELEMLLQALPSDVFVADDSLGWVYQFWQAEQKDRVNKSEKKIGADELPAVTQLFTEDYMVLFLLHNTLGAWWAGKILAARPELAKTVASEDELREACALPGIDWEYLRFVKNDDGTWRPASGTFEGWPKAAKDITVLDPCMGSGHFLVFALPILMAFRMEEEGLSSEAAIDVVLRDNLFGLEIDPRCTQIAAFNLALAAWKLVGYRTLPALNLACSGLGLNTKKEEWLKLAGNVDRMRQGMVQLYELFQQAPDLGTLINPRVLGGNLFVAEFHDIRLLLDKALAQETDNETIHELAVTARGVAKVAEILAGQFTLVATNVPYLTSGKQDEVLKDYCERVHPKAKTDLATCFVERCLSFCVPGGSTALVTPQSWLFLGTYKKLRQQLLGEFQWDYVARLGARAFETITGEVVNVSLILLSRTRPGQLHTFAAADVSAGNTPKEKTVALRFQLPTLSTQQGQLSNPDARVVVGEAVQGALLNQFADSYWGQGTGDFLRFGRNFWEFPRITDDYDFMQSTVTATTEWGGRELVVYWQQGAGELVQLAEDLRERLKNIHRRGESAWGKQGVCVSLMRELWVTRYGGQIFDGNCAAVIPKDPNHLPSIWAFCSSPFFNDAVREIDQALKVTNATLVKRLSE